MDDVRKINKHFYFVFSSLINNTEVYSLGTKKKKTNSRIVIIRIIFKKFYLWLLIRILEMVPTILDEKYCVKIVFSVFGSIRINELKENYV